MAFIQIPVAVIEFNEGDHTMWIHGPEGGTVLRIKTTGKFTAKECNVSPVSHADIMVEGDVEFCLGVNPLKHETPAK